MRILHYRRKISRRDFASRWVQCALGAVVAALIAVSLSFVGWRWSHFLDVIGIDFAFGYRGAVPASIVAEKLPQSRDIVMVELPPEIPRAVLAKLINKLRMAKVVGLDLMFSDQEGDLSDDQKTLFTRDILRWRKENQVLAASIARANNVVVGMWPDRTYEPIEGNIGQVESKVVWKTPEKSILNGAILAHLGVLPDEQDGIIRRIALWENTGQITRVSTLKTLIDQGVPAFALAIAAKASGISTYELAGRMPLLNDGSMYVDYLGGRQIFEYETNRVVFERAVNWYDAEDFKDKIVLVGQTDYRSKDTFATPFGDMPGVLIHANIVATILSEKGAPAPLALPYTFAISLLAGLLIIAPLIRYPVWMCLPVALLEIVIFCLLSAIIFAVWHLVLPISSPIITIFLTYNLVALYEYSRARRALGRVVGEEVMEQLLDAVATPTLGGKQTVATAFFCDLRGYTTLSQTLPPEKLLALLNLYTAALVREVQVFHGRPIDFFGDGVFVLFEGSNHAMRAFKAALAAQQAIRNQFLELRNAAQNRPELEEAAAHRLKAGIALHTGPMMVGFVGSESRIKPSAVGDNVNVAARVQALSDECGYSILLTKETLEAALKDNESLRVSFMDNVDVVLCGSFTLKGREGKTEVFGAGEKFKRLESPLEQDKQQEQG
jgi:adenylate cyclase